MDKWTNLTSRLDSGCWVQVQRKQGGCCPPLLHQLYSWTLDGMLVHVISQIATIKMDRRLQVAGEH